MSSSRDPIIVRDDEGNVYRLNPNPTISRKDEYHTAILRSVRDENLVSGAGFPRDELFYVHAEPEGCFGYAREIRWAESSQVFKQYGWQRQLPCLSAAPYLQAVPEEMQEEAAALINAIIDLEKEWASPGLCSSVSKKSVNAKAFVATQQLKMDIAFTFSGGMQVDRLQALQFYCQKMIEADIGTSAKRAFAAVIAAITAEEAKQTSEQLAIEIKQLFPAALTTFRTELDEKELRRLAELKEKKGRAERSGNSQKVEEHELNITFLPVEDGKHIKERTRLGALDVFRCVLLDLIWGEDLESLHKQDYRCALRNTSKPASRVDNRPEPRNRSKLLGRLLAMDLTKTDNVLDTVRSDISGYINERSYGAPYANAYCTFLSGTILLANNGYHYLNLVNMVSSSDDTNTMGLLQFLNEADGERGIGAHRKVTIISEAIKRIAAVILEMEEAVRVLRNELTIQQRRNADQATADEARSRAGITILGVEHKLAAINDIGNLLFDRRRELSVLARKLERVRNKLKKGDQFPGAQQFDQQAPENLIGSATIWQLADDLRQEFEKHVVQLFPGLPELGEGSGAGPRGSISAAMERSSLSEKGRGSDMMRRIGSAGSVDSEDPNGGAQVYHWGSMDSTGRGSMDSRPRGGSAASVGSMVGRHRGSSAEDEWNAWNAQSGNGEERYSMSDAPLGSSPAGRPGRRRRILTDAQREQQRQGSVGSVGSVGESARDRRARERDSVASASRYSIGSVGSAEDSTEGYRERNAARRRSSAERAQQQQQQQRQQDAKMAGYQQNGIWVTNPAAQPAAAAKPAAGAEEQKGGFFRGVFGS